MNAESLGGYVMLLPVWLILGIAAAAVYWNRGQEAGIGCLLGAILGPIGLIVALLTPYNHEVVRKRREADQLYRGELVRCSNCAELVQARAQICRFCGNAITRPETRPAATPPEDRQTRRQVEWGPYPLAGLVVGGVLVGAVPGQTYTILGGLLLLGSFGLLMVSYARER